MAELSAKSFLNVLERSQLVSDERLRQALTDLKQKAAGQTVDFEQLTRHLIESGLITEWHCEKLAAGKYKGYFLGKYKLLGHLGTGGMSTVYLAEHTLTGQKRAIKVLPRKKVDDKSFLDRFYREARAAAALNHPNVVRVYDICEESGTHFMVMEYAQGQDLYELVKARGPLPVDRALRYIREAAVGLAHAHERGLVHRDIKPANLLLTDDESIKILDLGLALLDVDDQESLTLMYNERVMGTADYLSPEQAVNSHDVDHRADIYSLGCTLYYLLTGVPPFPEGTLAQRIAMHQSKEPRDIRALRPEVPLEVVKFCSRMMRKKPVNRYQNCRELVEDIDAWFATGQFPRMNEAEQNFSFKLSPDTVAAESPRIQVDSRALDGSVKKTASRNPPPVPQRTRTAHAKRTRNQKAIWIGSAVSLGILAVAATILAYLKFSTSDAPASSDAGGGSTERTEVQRNANSVEDSDRGPGALSGGAPALTMDDLNGGNNDQTPETRGQAPESTAETAMPELQIGSTAGADAGVPGNSSHPPDPGNARVVSLSFENGNEFPSNRQVWDIVQNGSKVGTLGCFRQCQWIEDPTRAFDGKGSLLLFGNSDRVEFRPTPPEAAIASVEFRARRQKDSEPFLFEVQSKSLKGSERWKTVYKYDSRIQPISSDRYALIQIDNFSAVDRPEKFRFRLKGDTDDGLFIDDLKIQLTR